MSKVPLVICGGLLRVYRLHLSRQDRKVSLTTAQRKYRPELQIVKISNVTVIHLHNTQHIDLEN